MKKDEMIRMLCLTFKKFYPGGAVPRSELSLLLQQLGIAESILLSSPFHGHQEADDVPFEDFISWLSNEGGDAHIYVADVALKKLRQTVEPCTTAEASAPLRGKVAEAALSTCELALSVGLCSGLAALNTTRSTSRSLCEAASLALPRVREHCLSYVYICGGCSAGNPFNSTERLHLKTGNWEPRHQMEEARAGAVAGAVGGQLFVCGGTGAFLQPLSSVERYDASLGTWSTGPEMLAARTGASAGVLAGMFFVFGGIGPNSEVLSSVERLDPGQGAWVQLPPLSSPRAWSCAGAIPDTLHVCGGHDEKWQVVKTAEKLDVEKSEWQTMPDMMECRAAAVAATADRRLFVCGGWNNTVAFPIPFLSSVECYDPSACTWEAVPAMASCRAAATSVVLAGCIYVFGGSSGAGQALCTVEKYDPQGEIWSNVPDMAEMRQRSVAAIMAN